MWKKIEWNPSPTEFHPHSMICSRVQFFCIQLKAFCLNVIRMKIEPKGDEELLWPKMTLEKVAIGGHLASPQLVRIPRIKKQNVTSTSGTHCGTAEPLCTLGLLPQWGPQTPGTFQPCSPGLLLSFLLFRVWGSAVPLSTHLHDVNTLPQFWKDLCSLEEQIFKAKRFCCDGQKHKQ